MGFLGPEVDATGEFADTDDVNPLRDSLSLQGRCVGELFVEQSRAEVGEEGKMFANREQGGTFWLFSGR